ncbi:type II toxin-antitoxin system RelE/ParE family toxin [Longitalea arenae]|uniref:type II toxin-antitoxin system RelE/ParE family toxin n=1 Tax=Longitalea arenae TaxID=2812558 RepID=UPI001967BCFC|nr:type II toxin-antitoxin system RelE/ParE family toxin [Longitalea arenae]
MAFEVEWTEPVIKDLETIAGYIDREWSCALGDKFVDELIERVKVLAKQPFMGMASTRYPSIRSIKISKHNRLYYRIEEEKLVLLNIFDLRQHPAKNKHG